MNRTELYAYFNAWMYTLIENVSLFVRKLNLLKMILYFVIYDILNDPFVREK